MPLSPHSHSIVKSGRRTKVGREDTKKKILEIKGKNRDNDTETKQKIKKEFNGEDSGGDATTTTRTLG